LGATNFQHSEGDKKMATAKVIELPQLRLKELNLVLIGDSTLVMHRWSEKAKEEMLRKQQMKTKLPREPKDPKAEYANSMYIIDEKEGDRARIAEGDTSGIQFGFPSTGLKSAAVSACRFADMKMTHARGAFHVLGDMVEISGEPALREDMVRIGMGTADLRYRGEFLEWKAHLRVQHNSSFYSPEQIVNLFNTAGFGVGIGEHRPEKSGSWGMFHVATEGEL
jgi:hypothetical protein